MKQIRAPLEALFKRRGSTTPGSFTQGVPPAAAVAASGEGSTLSAGGALPAGLEARRAALLATLQGGGGGLPAGKYVVEVDASGEFCCEGGCAYVRSGKAPPWSQQAATSEDRMCCCSLSTLMCLYLCAAACVP
jgi:hypothetical protein